MNVNFAAVLPLATNKELIHQMESTTTLDNLAMIEDSASQFAETHIKPHVMEWDEIQNGTHQVNIRTASI